MSGLMTVMFEDTTEHVMSINDIVLLRRLLPPLQLDFITSQEHLKVFQAFVKKEQDRDEVIAPPPSLSGSESC